MSKIERVPRNYQGTQPTGREIKELLRPILDQVAKTAQDKPGKLIEAWPDIVGQKLAPMTKAVSFESGVFTVSVSNSTLYSLLEQHEKQRLLIKIQEAFPNFKVRKLLFRMG